MTQGALPWWATTEAGMLAVRDPQTQTGPSRPAGPGGKGFWTHRVEVVLKFPLPYPVLRRSIALSAGGFLLSVVAFALAPVTQGWSPIFAMCGLALAIGAFFLSEYTAPDAIIGKGKPFGVPRTSAETARVIPASVLATPEWATISGAAIQVGPHAALHEIIWDVAELPVYADTGALTEQAQSRLADAAQEAVRIATPRSL